MTNQRPAVLIVEDERIVAKDLRETLEAVGYDAFAIASSADEALTRATERCPDLILMDIRIKGERDGIETATVMRERFDVPVVYLTAHADDATIARATTTGPYGYLLKPVKPAELRSAIEVSLYRHQLERRLRERERRFATTLRSISDAVITVDLAGNVIYMNPAAEALTGASEAEALGRPAREIVRLLHAEAATDIDLPLERVMRENQPGSSSEVTIVRRDDTRRLVGDSASPVTDAGQLLGAVMVFRDITEQRNLQQQRELADRLESLGTLAAGVAHQVNNPLVVVTANAEFAADEISAVRAELGSWGGDVAERLREAAHAQTEISSSATRIARIVDDLKEFARAPEPTSGEADVGRAIEWAIRKTAHELRSRATLVASFANMPMVRADEARLAQVLVNLLVNAAHAIAPGAADENQVSITATAPGEQVVIEVRDTGVGIPREILGRIFEPFFTTKPVGEGTGLGLSISHGIVRSMGGTLEVESTVGVGSTFRVGLPILAAGVEATTRSRSHVARRGRILVIDDDAGVQRVIKRILKHHDLVCLDQVREALDLIDRGEHFDVVVSDVMMPNMTGIDLYEALLERHPEVARRVVFMTAGAFTPKASDFLHSIPNPVIEKPFGRDELHRVIDAMLATAT